MSLLRKRYDMIALLLQAAPKVHHNLPKAIITLNSPEAIIAGDLLCGRLAKGRLCCVIRTDGYSENALSVFSLFPTVYTSFFISNKTKCMAINMPQEEDNIKNSNNPLFA